MLELHDIYKMYDGLPLLRGVSFRVPLGKTVCLLGPSGSGKSTLLQIVAGLQFPDSGRVSWERKDLGLTPPHLRDFGLVFQDYALFPHLNVFDNIAFGLKMRRWSRADIARRVDETLRLVNLVGLQDRSVTELSGGEQQRVALARALAPGPRLLMFDEPLGALDRALKQELLDQLRRILRQTRVAALYVTHDQEEAFRIADRILLLHDGRIVRAGGPPEVWADPRSAWAADFLGLGNIAAGIVLEGSRTVKTAYGIFPLSCSHRHKTGQMIQLLIRPMPAEDGAVLRGVVRDTLFLQDNFTVLLEGDLRFDLPKAPRLGSSISIRVRPECLGVDSDRQTPSPTGSNDPDHSS